MRAMRNFCMVDIVLCDGDPYILPWSREGTDLLCLCNQVWVAQSFGGSMNTTMLGTSHCLALILFLTIAVRAGSAVTTQMMQYLSMIGPDIIGVFNGNSKGGKLKPDLERIDLTQEAPRSISRRPSLTLTIVCSLWCAGGLLALSLTVLILALLSVLTHCAHSVDQWVLPVLVEFSWTTKLGTVINGIERSTIQSFLQRGGQLCIMWA